MIGTGRCAVDETQKIVIEECKCSMKINYAWQLMLRSETKYFAKGSIIADSHDKAKALMVINSGLVCLPRTMNCELNILIEKAVLDE